MVMVMIMLIVTVIVIMARNWTDWWYLPRNSESLRPCVCVCECVCVSECVCV
jgi:hypothetical protein